MRENQPAPEYSIVLRPPPPIALLAASSTARTSFTSWAFALAVMRTKNAARSLFAKVVYQVEVFVVLIADVLEELGVRLVRELLRDGPRFRVRLRVVDRHLDVHVAEIFPNEPLRDACFVRGRLAGIVDPALVVEAGRLDDQRISVPMADGIAEPRRLRIGREGTAIGEDLPVGVHRLVQDHDHPW